MLSHIQLKSQSQYKNTELKEHYNNRLPQDTTLNLLFYQHIEFTPNTPTEQVAHVTTTTVIPL